MNCTLRCELHRAAGGTYCLRVVNSQEDLPLLEQHFTDRQRALALGFRLYLGFKDPGWYHPVSRSRPVS